jgi:hypothetical protein
METPLTWMLRFVYKTVPMYLLYYDDMTQLANRENVVWASQRNAIASRLTWHGSVGRAGTMVVALS